MKLKSLFTILFLALLSSSAFSQFNFNVSPGLGLTGAKFGFQLPAGVVPYFALQSFSTTDTYEESGTRWDFDQNKAVTYTNTDEYKVSMLIPSLGAKYFFKGVGPLKPFVNASISKPLVNAKVTYDGQEDKEIAEAAKSLKFFGAEVSFGIEYFLSEYFSLSGEFGLRMMSLKFDDEFEDQYYDPIKDEYIATVLRQKIQGSFNPTYSNISLNFYLNRG
jgi:hypothetical protein